MAAAHCSSSNFTLSAIYGIILRLLLLHKENKIFSQADRQGFMFCSFSNLENENILLTGCVFFNRSIFYPFMSEARQINGFWNLFPMLILFPKF